MRICIYTETALPMVGGQELVVDALAREFQRAGHEVVVLAPRPRSYAQGRKAETPYRVVRHPRFISSRRLVELYRWWLIGLWRRFRYDIVHCHSVHPTGYLAVLARSVTRAPVVITSHGGDINAANPRLAKPGVRQKHVMAVEAADALVSISAFTQRGYRALAPQAREAEHIPNGVDIAAATQPVERPASLDTAVQSGDYVLFLGRLSRRKGVDVLLEAHALLDASARPMLVIAGDGEEDGALRAQAERLGIAARVIFAGRVEGAAKTWLLQNCMFAVMPSREWEAFPLVVLEAFASARPLVATRIPGLEDLVEPGVTGWLAPPEDPGAFAEALGQALAQPDLVGQFGANARQKAQAHGWPAIAGRYLDLFERLLRARRGSSQPSSGRGRKQDTQ